MYAIQLALAANPDIRAAEERVRIADAALARARAEFLPRLGVAEFYDLSNNPETASSLAISQGRFSPTIDPRRLGYVDDFHTQAYAQQSLYAGGKRLAQERSAEALRDASNFSLVAVQNELVFRVAEAYYRLLQNRDLLQARREAVEQVERELAAVQARTRAGTAVKSDLLLVEVRLAEVREALITAEGQWELGWAVLKNTLGVEVQGRALPAGVPPVPWSDRIDTVEAAVGAAIEQRPEIGELRSRSRSAGHDVRTAQAAWYPTVDFVIDHDVHTEDFRQGNSSLFLELAARLILFDGGRTREDVRKARARVGELLARQERQALDIELDVRRTYVQLMASQERLRVATEAVAQANEGLRAMESQYRNQSTTLTELIGSQVALSNARVRQVREEAELQIARADLERAVGRLTCFAGQ
jgi:outer membrane protein TolC